MSASDPRGPSAPPPDPGDIPAHSPFVDFLPPPLRPYARLMRLDRPIGSWLLLLPCWWGVMLSVAAADMPPDWPRIVLLLALFAVGAVAMRGAGCVWNDILDRDIDARVARTATRPLASGRVSLAGAMVLLLLLCLVGAAVLWGMNMAARLAVLPSIALVALYPLMKRVTYWPQLWLGLTLNWGIWVGSAAVLGSPPLFALPLYLAGIFWTLGYDTIYAHQDRPDDLLVGVKSSALKLGPATHRWIAGFYIAVMALVCLAVTTVRPALLLPAAPFLPLAALHLFFQLRQLNIDDPAVCLRLFRSNKNFGLILFAGFCAAALFS